MRKAEKAKMFLLLILLSLFSASITPDSASPASLPAIQVEEPQKNIDDGWKAFTRGDLEQAVNHWLKAAQGYQDAQKPSEQIETLIHLAHAYQSLGQFKNSAKSLAVATVLSERANDLRQSAAVFGALGNLYLVTGPGDRAEHYLNEALQLARATDDRLLTASILNNLGNLEVVQKQYDQAVNHYSESATLGKAGGNPLLAATALVNAAMAATQSGNYKTTIEFLQNGLDLSRQLAPSSDKVYALINGGLAYADVSRRLGKDGEQLFSMAAKILDEAVKAAVTIGDRRGESYALGYLARLYEDERRYDEALVLTRKAVFAAHQVNAPEALYRWEWQTGRLLKAQGNIDDAISAYRRAVRTLQSIRQEISVAYGNPRSSFRNSVGPVYFELVDLLLQSPTATQDREKSQALLVEARDTLELFKAAELKDYFRDDCVDAARARITRLDVVASNAVVVYPIVLPDRLELLVSLPAGLKKITMPVTAEALTQEVREFRKKLEKRTTNEFLPYAQSLYQWLIRPLEADLNSLLVDTLVFVPDGALRTIPMAALHDGKQFLIAKYPLAITPGLDLTDPQPLRRERLRILAVGLSESVQGFPELPHVAGELHSIQQMYGGNSLINQEYLVSRVEKELKENHFNVVHVASHGEFSSDVDKTFLLTFDDKLTMDRLDQYVGLFRFRDDPLELLTLSACETAAGDDRAALGLAGIAIKAGARSALASLWFINDQATATLVEEFYRQLQDPSVSRAVALQRAQSRLLDDLRYRHPGYWAPFLLINNWL